MSPPEIFVPDGPTVFLAGPIQGAPDWQRNAQDFLLRYSTDLFVANPRREYVNNDFILDAQVDWETAMLRYSALSGGILFWLAKKDPAQNHPDGERAYAQTSRYELGEWTHAYRRNPRLHLAIGIEAGFSGEKYLRHRLAQDCPRIPIRDNLLDTCADLLDLVDGP